jgi:hypothetical protein
MDNDKLDELPPVRATLGLEPTTPALIERFGPPLFTEQQVKAYGLALITRLHAEITQRDNTIDGLEFQLNQARAESEALKSDAAAFMPPCG